MWKDRTLPLKKGRGSQYLNLSVAWEAKPNFFEGADCFFFISVLPFPALWSQVPDSWVAAPHGYRISMPPDSDATTLTTRPVL